MTTGVIIVAGGSGNRMGSSIPKQFHFLGNRPVLAHTIDAFARALPRAALVVVLPAEHIDYWRNLSARFDVAPHRMVAGGRERFDSVLRGLEALPSETELIAVQDGVRPLVSRGLIRRMFEAAEQYGAAIPVVAPVDSFRSVEGEDDSIIVDRRRLRIVQTPQVFRGELLRDAYRVGYRPEFTDDASVVEASGCPIHLCEGERANLKITTREDLVVAAALLEMRDEEGQRQRAGQEGTAPEDAAEAADGAGER